MTHRRRARCLLGAALLAPGLVVSGVLGPPYVAAQELGPVEPGSVDPPPGLGLSAAVEALDLTSPELDAARTRRDELVERRDSARERSAQITSELASLTIEVQALRGLAARRDAQLDKSAQAQLRARRALSGAAVEGFITGFGALDGLDPALTQRERDEVAHRRILSQAAASAAVDDVRVLGAHVAALRVDRDEVRSVLATQERRTAQLESEQADLTALLTDAERLLPELDLEVTAAAMRATVRGTNLSALALDAYWRASRALALLRPTCGLEWWLLAGIGRTESHHGTYRGATLGLDGRVDPPIYGPHLDGSNAFAIVPDSDGGRLDGTAATDRATGPMQFLPSTWRMVGTDGDGDGLADPQNLFDAATSAGVYLCRSGPLDSEERLRRAVLTYNRSNAYVDVVLERGRGYASTVGLPG